MEFLIILALLVLVIVGLNELREWRNSARHRELLGKLESLALHQGGIASLLEGQKAQSERLEAIQMLAESMHERIGKAETDLATIVQEYEINGVPLGYDRGRKPADFVEGL